MEHDFVIPARFSVDVPSFADYFGLWSIEPEAFQNLVGRYQGLNLHAHIRSATAEREIARQDKTEYAVTTEGIAILEINGPMMKRMSSMSDGTSTVRVRQQLRSAMTAKDVKGAMLVMDTPGGTVKGNEDLANDVAAFAATKPLFAFTEDMTASAGVSVASQATKRFANGPTALYGGMGTYAVLVDMTGRAEQLGMKVHVIKAGAFKGMGEPGTEVTESQLNEAQRIVNALNENYLGLIARGLGKELESVRQLADGRVHPASVAASLGLIDGFQSIDETYSQLVAATKARSAKANSTPVRSKTMEDEAATLAELKAAFPNSSAEWRESQLESGATLPKAAIAYAAHVEERAAADRAEYERNLAAVEAKVKATSTSLGHDAIRVRGPEGERSTVQDSDDAEYVETGDAIDDFNAEVAKLAGPRPDLVRRQRAVRTIASRNPQLYEAYLLAANPGRRQTRMITEKMESFAR